MTNLVYKDAKKRRQDSPDIRCLGISGSFRTPFEEIDTSGVSAPQCVKERMGVQCTDPLVITPESELSVEDFHEVLVHEGNV